MPYNLGNELNNKIILINKKSYKDFIKPYEKYINFVDFRKDDKKNYGFKDKNNLDILPKEEKILFDDEYNIVCLDFVIFAYKEMVEKYYSLLDSSQISKKSVINKCLSNPKISQVGLEFEPILEKNSKEFNSRVITDYSLNIKTRNVFEYIDTYCLEILNLRSRTQTHIKYINTNVLKNVNGLTITLIEDNMGNDEKKVEFISDLNFPILRKLAEQYGFYINQDAPWQLIANLSHPNIKKIVATLYPNEKESDITTDFIIEEYYDRLLFIDYDLQKNFLYNSYVDLYNKHYEFTQSEYCDRQKKTILKRLQRSEPGDYDAYLKNKLFFLVSYLKILNTERTFKYSLTELNKIIFEVKKIYSTTLDEEKALVYIYSQFDTVVP